MKTQWGDFGTLDFELANIFYANYAKKYGKNSMCVWTPDKVQLYQIGEEPKRRNPRKINEKLRQRRRQWQRFRWHSIINHGHQSEATNGERNFEVCGMPHTQTSSKQFCGPFQLERSNKQATFCGKHKCTNIAFTKTQSSCHEFCQIFATKLLFCTNFECVACRP